MPEKMNCPFCGEEFYKKSNVTRHLRNPNPCENILGETKTREAMVYEFTRHIDNPFACKYCNKQYANINTMYAHRKRCIYNPANIRHENTNENIEPTVNLMIDSSTNTSTDPLPNIEMRNVGCFHKVSSIIKNIIKCW